jgi:hypothetical protein
MSTKPVRPLGAKTEKANGEEASSMKITRTRQVVVVPGSQTTTDTLTIECASEDLTEATKLPDVLKALAQPQPAALPQPSASGSATETAEQPS